MLPLPVSPPSSRRWRGRRSFAATLGIWIACAASGCAKTDTPTAAPSTPPVDADADGPAEGTTQAACRDWSNLDVASLPALPATPYTETFEVAWQRVLTQHYDPTLNCLDWPALRLQYGQKLAEAKDEAAAYALMNQLLGELEQSHFRIVPPTTQTSGEVRGGVTMGPAVIASEVRFLDGKVVITSNEQFGLKSPLPVGAELVAVEDEQVAPMVEQMKAAWKTDLAASFHIARTAASWLTCPAGAKKKVTVLPHGAKAPKTKSYACREPEVQRLTMGNIRDFPAEVRSRMLPGKVGYVGFNIWLLPMAPQIQQAIRDLAAKGMKGLVIDLRGNPGGVGMMVVPLARVLLPEPGTLGEIRMRTMKQDFKVHDVDDPYPGPIIVLIDERTGSTSEIFAEAMRQLGRVSVYGGGPSQGAALPSLIEELPGGAKLQFVIADYKSPKGTAVEGNGVQPDVVVPESAADFAAGKDPVLLAAAEALRSGTVSTAEPPTPTE